ncbi:PQQ-binding-like beta-propeller repeat protein [Natronosalvus rutilus]|uniref:PQQ-like beta-propeller repeat protein n=1 Tax=Natronosalvus rutilus TaxID=2953753 RepID=A0A9E7N742_9EURY|nr:PQQ-binding-like beta-propeller repeat protein [Natronosalvus rutilus]UTF52146.1 PQQ-like beta-propeller repeat protein [Natronosalvus rutilus]
MAGLNRRTVLSAGAALSTTGVLASVGSVLADGYGEGDEDSSEDGDGSHRERPTEIAWRYDGAHDLGSIVIADDRIYTLVQGGVTALDAEDGSSEWETGDIDAERTLSTDGDVLYVAGDPIRAIGAETGDVRWESEIDSLELAVGHGMVYTASEHTVYALDTEDGSIQWERERVEVETADGTETAEELQFGDVSEDAVYVFDSAYAPGRAGMFAGLDPETGETVVTVDPDESVSQVTAGSGHVAIFPAYDATYLYEMATREVVASTSMTRTNSIVDETYFALGRDGNLSAYDLSESGERRWTTDSYHSLPALVGETVITAYGPDSADIPDEEDDEDRVLAYDLETGEERWRYAFDEREWIGSQESIVADENTVYVSRDGELLALRTEDEEDGDEEEPDEDDQTDEDPGDEEPTSIDLSVTGPDSIAHDESADFTVTLRNDGTEPVELDVTLEVEDRTRSGTVEIAGEDCISSTFTVAGSDLPTGDVEWAIVAGEQRVEGTLTVEGC